MAVRSWLQDPKLNEKTVAEGAVAGAGGVGGWELGKPMARGAFVTRVDPACVRPPRHGTPRTGGAPSLAARLQRLAGLRFAVQDSIHVEGYVTGFGSRRWHSLHAPEPATAPVVLKLMDCGARLMGKTCMAEYGYSLHAVNHDYGAPVNPSCPHRIVGASSGAAAAVAAAEVDFAVVVDTYASMAVPAAYCGIFSFRCTLDPKQLEATVGVARGLDSIGLMTRSAGLLHKVGNALLDLPDREVGQRLPKRLIAVDDAMGLCSSALQGVLSATATAIRMLNTNSPGHTQRRKSDTGLQIAHIHLGNALLNKVPELKEFQVPSLEEEEDVSGQLGVGRSRGLEAVRQLHQLVQRAFDVVGAAAVGQAQALWEAHGEWIRAHAATTIPEDLRRDLRVTKRVDPSTIRSVHRDVRARLHTLVKDGVVLLLPVTPGPAPLITAQWSELRAWNATCLRINCIPGIAGLPMVTIPVVLPDMDGSMAISLIAAPGQDELLLDLALLLSTHLQSTIAGMSRPRQQNQGDPAPASSSALPVHVAEAADELVSPLSSTRAARNLFSSGGSGGGRARVGSEAGSLGHSASVTSLHELEVAEPGEESAYGPGLMGASRLEVARWVVGTAGGIVGRRAWEAAGQLAVVLKQLRVQATHEEGHVPPGSNPEIEDLRCGVLLSAWVAMECARKLAPQLGVVAVALALRMLYTWL